MVSLFSSKEYVLYRFEYPENLFHPLRAGLCSAESEKITVLDLGCGTGLVSESFLKFYQAPVDLHLVDVDSEMLKRAPVQLGEKTIRSMECTSSDKISLSQSSVDLVLIGSAWHWMKQEATIQEISRVLKPGGMVFVFEYQFPKTITHPALNDWIRIQFNSIWKPSSQVPRGSLKELTEQWRAHSEFAQVDTRTVLQDRLHDAESLAGVIVSQSRYQHFEQSFPKSEHSHLRSDLVKNLEGFLKGESANFSYSYEGYLFKKRV